MYKKNLALLIGINYKNSKIELDGCINDSNNLQKFLISKMKFKSNEIIQMTDNHKGNLYPTGINIIRQLKFIHSFNE